MEILDQENKTEEVKINRAKTFNLIAILSLLIGVAIASIQIIYRFEFDFNPLLPRYTIFYSNYNKINICLVILIGMFPTLYLRLRKRYLLSTCAILAFGIIGVLFMNNLKLYTILYYFI